MKLGQKAILFISFITIVVVVMIVVALFMRKDGYSNAIPSKEPCPICGRSKCFDCDRQGCSSCKKISDHNNEFSASSGKLGYM
jgi:hypothetical protein